MEPCRVPQCSGIDWFEALGDPVGEDGDGLHVAPAAWKRGAELLSRENWSADPAGWLGQAGGESLHSGDQVVEMGARSLAVELSGEVRDDVVGSFDGDGDGGGPQHRRHWIESSGGLAAAGTQDAGEPLGVEQVERTLRRVGGDALLRDDLVVAVAEVVDAVGGWMSAERGVGPVKVVAVQPGRERGDTLG
ncbi:hypothetical protein GCM10009836_44820 [Pseudonocardia ailaonensis]|uniref:Uncharacterized protein n=1 Tax=Pseudonocardia ailaonensis TaxID=367279 RepID=A0ABN2NBC7_9PSEU